MDDGTEDVLLKWQPGDIAAHERMLRAQSGRKAGAAPELGPR